MIDNFRIRCHRGTTASTADGIFLEGYGIVDGLTLPTTPLARDDELRSLLLISFPHYLQSLRCHLSPSTQTGSDYRQLDFGKSHWTYITIFVNRRHIIPTSSRCPHQNRTCPRGRSIPPSPSSLDRDRTPPPVLVSDSHLRTALLRITLLPI